MANPDEDVSEAINRLFELYADEIYRFVRFSLGNPVEVEDIVQDVFLQAMRSWGSFRGASSEKTWLWSIARHRVVDWIRQHGRETASLQKGVDRLESASPDSDARNSDARIDLERAVQRLPMGYRQVLILRVVQDKSATETASILGWSNVKVRVTLYRALEALEGLIQREHSSPEGEGGSRGRQGMERDFCASIRS